MWTALPLERLHSVSGEAGIALLPPCGCACARHDAGCAEGPGATHCRKRMVGKAAFHLSVSASCIANSCGWPPTQGVPWPVQ